VGEDELSDDRANRLGVLPPAKIDADYARTQSGLIRRAKLGCAEKRIAPISLD
jgi:hypothetical protein